MAKMKGYKKLNQQVTYIFQDLTGFDDFKCKLGSEWAYYNHKNKVEFSLIDYPDGTVRDWFKWIFNRYDFIPENHIIFSMLHEIGHHVTLDKFIVNNPDLWAWEEKEDADITEAMNNVDLPEYFKTNLRWQYHSLPAEILATEWAIDFCKTHKETVMLAYQDFCKACIEFYNANGLDENGEEIGA